jgi:hypothetical protein
MQDGPRDTVRCEEVTEESTDVSELVGFVSVDGFKVFDKGFLEIVRPDPIELTESFADKTVKV